MKLKKNDPLYGVTPGCLLSTDSYTIHYPWIEIKSVVPLDVQSRSSLTERVHGPFLVISFPFEPGNKSFTLYAVTPTHMTWMWLRNKVDDRMDIKIEERAL